MSRAAVVKSSLAIALRVSCTSGRRPKVNGEDDGRRYVAAEYLHTRPETLRHAAPTPTYGDHDRMVVRGRALLNGRPCVSAVREILVPERRVRLLRFAV
ncbi:hypothetical protein P280DRAFT_52029 [Massarina eburnea CBS 473.64]|uniref:Uncharacterized protein n=1 Tax=Massarina eburnea CBS 473.64 TaxID=1395130 RepID=A0A6A6RX21_9PLEO|nr:hypothetical protein P280DRAFT_52029 [Massarina eburnea CBS 473.64]